MSIKKSDVIHAASSIADESGLTNVSLKAVAEKLGIRTPSLYNHIDSLDDLLREVAHEGMRTANERMGKAAIGKSGDDAIRSVGVEYLNILMEHPGLYETIQWATWHGSEETAKLFQDYTSLLTTLILSYNFREDGTGEILDLLTGFFHGYITMQLRYAFTHPSEARQRLCDTIDIVLLGIHQKFDSKSL